MSGAERTPQHCTHAAHQNSLCVCACVRGSVQVSACMCLCACVCLCVRMQNIHTPRHCTATNLGAIPTHRATLRHTLTSLHHTSSQCNKLHRNATNFNAMPAHCIRNAINFIAMPTHCATLHHNLNALQQTLTTLQQTATHTTPQSHRTAPHIITFLTA